MNKDRLDRLKRIDELKEKIYINIRNREAQNNELLQDCLKNLLNTELISDKNEIQRIINSISDNFSIKYHHIENSYEIIRKEIDFIKNKDYYIVWDDADLPIIKCLGRSILTCLDDVTAVSFDTYIVAEDFSEILHCDEEDRFWRCF